MSDIGHNGGPAIECRDDAANNTGWIAIARSMRNHPIVGFGQPVAPMDTDRPAYSRAEAWLDLLMECRYSPGRVYNGGRMMEIKPGQLLGATSWLASRWNWTPKTVRVFLAKLENDAMIGRFQPGIMASPDQDSGESNRGKQKGKQASVITILNYREYQIERHLQGAAKGLARGQQGASKGLAEGNIYKEETKEQGNKETHTHNGSPSFDACVGGASPVVVDLPPVTRITRDPPPEGPLPGETEHAHGVFESAEQVRHRSFAISIEGLAMQLATANIGVSTTQAREISRTAALANAIQWAAEIANGKLSRDVLPSNPVLAIRGSIVRQRQREDAARPKGSTLPTYMFR